MDPKLVMLFLLIVTIIGLSHLSRENLTKMKRKSDSQSVDCPALNAEMDLVRSTDNIGGFCKLALLFG